MIDQDNQISKNSPLDKHNGDWDTTFQRLAEYKSAIAKAREKPFVSLGIGLCVIGVGLIGALATYYNPGIDALRRYLQVYSTLIIVTGLLLVLFRLLEQFRSK